MSVDALFSYFLEIVICQYRRKIHACIYTKSCSECRDAFFETPTESNRNAKIEPDPTLNQF